MSRESESQEISNLDGFKEDEEYFEIQNKYKNQYYRDFK